MKCRRKSVLKAHSQEILIIFIQCEIETHRSSFILSSVIIRLYNSLAKADGSLQYVNSLMKSRVHLSFTMALCTLEVDMYSSEQM